MTPDWLKPYALDELCTTLDCFSAGLECIHDDTDYPATTFAQAQSNISRANKSTLAIEWALAQQTPPGLHYDPPRIHRETTELHPHQAVHWSEQSYVDEFGREHK